MTKRFSRRQLFRMGPMGIVRQGMKEARETRGDDHPAPIRPPGAIADEQTFIETCEKCHQCAQACPHQVIHQLGPSWGAAEGTPYLMPEQSPCQWCPSMDCIHACPSGALRLQETGEVAPIAKAKLNLEHCLTRQGTLCDDCAQFCPSTVKAIRMIKREPVLDESKCVGCGLCAYYCDASPKAIEIVSDRREFNSASPPFDDK